MRKYQVSNLVPLLILGLGCTVAYTFVEPEGSPTEDSHSARIVGGYFAIEGQFPYQVSLQILASHTCGGSIISANYVLTAAHCVTYGEDKILPALVLAIRAGSKQLNVGGVIKRISKIIRHPQYSEFSNDVALLRLSTPLIFTDRIKAIPLASTDPPNGAAVTISGWGLTRDGGDVSSQLKSNTLRTITNYQCNRSISNLPASILCLAHARNNGACNGDSGGPGVYNNTLVGVANFVVNGCGSRSPDAYASVSSFRNWLIENSDLE